MRDQHVDLFSVAQHGVLMTVLVTHACCIGYVWADSATQRQCPQSYQHRQDAAGEYDASHSIT